VASYVARQPFVLERAFATLPLPPELSSPFLALNKPWGTRHDVPRGWPGKARALRMKNQRARSAECIIFSHLRALLFLCPSKQVRFTPKFEGDTSAEEWVEAHLRGGSKPHLEKARCAQNAFCNALVCIRCFFSRVFFLAQVRFAHQLDFATSGVLLSATSRSAAASAAACFAARTARKRYRCLLLGHPPSDAWTRTDAVAYDPADPAGFRMRCIDAAGDATAKSATTAFRVLSRGTCALEGPFLGAPVAHVEARPATGRRHQIRVHAAASGHPVLGDAAYSDDRDSFRMFLHAARLFLPLRAPARDGGARLAPLRAAAPLPRSFAVAMWPTPTDGDGGADDAAADEREEEQF
jgi:hypothetical protein